MAALTTIDADRAALGVLADREEPAFRARLDDVFPRLHAAVREVLGDALDGQERLTDAVRTASASWHARPLDLKVHGARRDPGGLAAAAGASCFVDRYAGNLAGLVDQVPHLRELGVTLLHLVDPFATDAAGVVDHRRIDPSLGSLPRLADVAAELRLAGIALLLDLGGGEPLTLAADALFLASHGVEAFRVDGGAEVVSAVLALGAPGTAVLTRAAPLPLWEAIATGDGRMLQRALDAPGTGTRAVRDPDAVRWDFADADADALGYAPQTHREWLTSFLTGDVAGSFARGARAGDGVAGTTASLAGVEAGDPLGEARVILAHALVLALPGTPLVWLGDEVAQLNDPSFTDDPARRDDPRWLHRGQKPRDGYAQRHDGGAPAGRVFAALTALTAARAAAPELFGGGLVPFHAADPAVVGFQRVAGDTVVLVLGNVSRDAVAVDAVTLSGFAPKAHDLLRGADVELSGGLELPPCDAVWLRVSPR